jgi:hypothetical protein
MSNFDQRNRYRNFTLAPSQPLSTSRRAADSVGLDQGKAVTRFDLCQRLAVEMIDPALRHPTAASSA